MSSSTVKICFNSECTDRKSERLRKGWRTRSGDCVELCDRCGSLYDEGRFCETFHLNASGWRGCKSCGKRVHCGCIASIHSFTLLDTGGIECIPCARKNVVLTPNPAWPPHFFLPLPERLKDPVKNWSQSQPVGPWHAPNLFNTSIPQSDLRPRMPSEADLSTGVDRLIVSERSSAFSMEKKKIEDSSERSMNGGLKLGALEMLENGNSGTNCEEQPASCVNIPQQSSSLNDDHSAPLLSLAVPYASSSETNGQTVVSGTLSQPTPSPPLAKKFSGHPHNGVDSSGEAQVRNGRPRGDARGRNQLLPRYWPRITDQELQQISGDSNSVITPLFEKMLSASDAGRIGRLVLPKKCAEAYFPAISQPEGLPLKVQDAKGHEWIFQFRFWPNNNSRMYVLEGVTPCIQSMQLQAGDTVTFSRLEPEGKLVMGFRKASTAPSSDQGNETIKTGNGGSTHGDVSIRKTKTGEVALTNRHLKSSLGSPSFSSMDQSDLADPASAWSKVDKSGYIAKEALGAKSSIPRKRKNSTLGSKSKRLRIENEDLIELKLTWEEAQGLLRPPLNHVPNVVVIEGYEFEEYEEPPIIGKPTIFATDDMGEKIQWAQCEDCFKWRKLPADVCLSSRWTCSENSWDPERSSCSATQEITAEQLEDLLPTSKTAASKKMKAAKQDSDTIEALEGLDTLANLAILGEGEALPPSSQATTKHPRHRPGCSCIVCIQPPSGKGPKHKQTCTCNVCLTVKRRFRTLMMRREKKQSEKEAETARKKQQEQLLLPEKITDDDPLLCSNSGNSGPNKKKVVNEGSDDDPNKRKSLTTSPFKGQIDLNIQPEREEESSPGSDSGSMMRLLQDATERCLRQQLSSSSAGNRSSSGNQTHLEEDEPEGEKLGNGLDPGTSKQDSDINHPVALSMNASASTSATG
ncbi:hypothetical protein VitviT2T_015002 [Vitis vinifera]|uniref:B3 domain-containing protein n=1 Tax=Vitis vinifera TaxID=29760 RepID=A0ABY9CM54_VITVI|nr:B3 domain-containing protein Os07g0563300 isoform X1 [Vitis vinifera]WJZ96306.1 hypothetical protein VitviT2T_015002 [Vitis vinifera]